MLHNTSNFEMKTKKPPGGVEVGRPDEEYKWESEFVYEKLDVEKIQRGVHEGPSPITTQQGEEIIHLLKDIKSGLELQKKQTGREMKGTPEYQNELIEELSDEMEKDTTKYYAISTSERKIVASNESEWNLLNKLGHKKTIKIKSSEYPRDDIFIFCPGDIWFE